MNRTFIVTFSILTLIILAYLMNKSTSNDSNNIITTNSLENIETFDYEQYISSEIMITDFNYLVEKIIEVHPDPKRNFEGNWSQVIEEMKIDFANPMPIGEYALKLMSFTSKLNDAHTEVYPQNLLSKQLPVGFQWVKEGLVISKSYVDALNVGDLVLKIGDYTINDIFQKLSEYISSENEYWMKHKGLGFLRQEIFLEHFSFINDDSVKITVERDHTIFDIDLKLVTNEDIQLLNSIEQHTWYSWDFRENLNIGYFNIEESNISAEFEKEVAHFFYEVSKANIDNVIIDLRSNSGGNSGVVNSFLKHMPLSPILPYTGVIKFSQEASLQLGYQQSNGNEVFIASAPLIKSTPVYKGNIYILTSPATFSSGSMFAVLFYDNKLATIIGEPTGGSPSSFGDTIMLELPYTKFTLLISHKEFIRPDDTQSMENTLYPNISDEKTQADILGKDPQLERILKMIRES